MTAQIGSVEKVKILDEIINNAIELPLESQDWLLMMAKSMRYTRNCMVRQQELSQPRNLPRQPA